MKIKVWLMAQEIVRILDLKQWSITEVVIHSRVFKSRLMIPNATQCSLPPPHAALLAEDGGRLAVGRVLA